MENVYYSQFKLMPLIIQLNLYTKHVSIPGSFHFLIYAIKLFVKSLRYVDFFNFLEI